MTADAHALTPEKASQARAQFNACKAMAAEADRMIRERYGLGYEVLYRGEDDTFVVAAPMDESEGGDPDQPTAICCGWCDDFEDAEQLYQAAIRYADEVDKLAASYAREDEE